MAYVETQSEELADAMLEMRQMFGSAKAEEILRGYQEMAANEKGEAEALEWIESQAGECL